MSRFVRNTVMQIKAETVYGVAETTFASTDAILLAGDPTVRFDNGGELRDLVRGYFGTSEELITTRRGEITFKFELAGSGAAGTAPAWGPLMIAAGMAETVTAGQYVEYLPISTGFGSATVRFALDGVRYVFAGGRATWKAMFPIYGRPMCEMTMRFVSVAFSAVAQPATDFTPWKQPEVVADANSSVIRLGCTYATGNISGGTVLSSRGIELDLGNELQAIELLGGDSIDITDRNTTGSMSTFLTAANEVSWRTDVNANTLTGLGFAHGSAAGSRIRMFAPAVQRINMQPENYQKRLLAATDLKFLPTSAGNNEIRIIAA